jgi:hypothetical protein
MITANPNPAAHAGEAQASRSTDPREAYWKTVEAELLKLSAASKLYAAAAPAVIGGAA